MMIEDKEGTEKKGKMKRMLEKLKKEELAKAEENVRKAVKEMPNGKEKDKIEKSCTDRGESNILYNFILQRLANPLEMPENCWKIIWPSGNGIY
jgi:DNA-binding transcriptional regulator PaaX